MCIKNCLSAFSYAENNNVFFGGMNETADAGEAAVAIPTAMFVGDAALSPKRVRGVGGTQILLQS